MPTCIQITKKIDFSVNPVGKSVAEMQAQEVLESIRQDERKRELRKKKQKEQEKKSEGIIVGFLIPRNEPSPDMEPDVVGEVVIGAARNSKLIDYVLDAAQHLGIQIPNAFVVYKAELFYKDARLHSVRLQGRKGTDAGLQGTKPKIEEWVTPEAPKFELRRDDRISLSSADEGKAFVVIQLLDEVMIVKWDVRDNAPAKEDSTKLSILYVVKPEEDTVRADDDLNTSLAHEQRMLHNTAVEFLKTYISTSPPDEFGKRRTVSVKFPFGTVTINYHDQDTYRMFAEHFVRMIEMLPEDLFPLMSDGLTTETQAKTILLNRWETATRQFAEKATALFDSKIERNTGEVFDQLAQEVEVNVFATLNDPFILLAKKTEVLREQVMQRVKKESGRRMGTRPRGATEKVTTEKVEAAIIKLGKMANQKSVAAEIRATSRSLHDWAKSEGFTNWKAAQASYEKQEESGT